jgi:hypothetical protein
MIWLYWRHYSRMRDLCWLMPAAVATLSPNARTELWIFCGLPAFAAWLRTTPLPPPEPRPALLTSLATAGGVLVAVALVGIIGFRTKTALTLTPVYPLYTDANGRIAEITVQLHNGSQREVTPEFFLQPRFEDYSSSWRIIDGPMRLSPGDSANYTIEPPAPDKGFFVGTRLVAIDSGGNWGGPLVLGEYEDYSFPDSSFNSRFHLWTRGASAPNGWQLEAAPPSHAGIAVTTVDERNAVALQIEQSDGPTISALETTIGFPYQPFQVWIWHDALPETATFAVEFDDGQHQALVDFAATTAETRVTLNRYREQRPVPEGEWTLQTIDLLAIYETAGWELPEMRNTVYRELELDWRLVKVRIVLAGRPDQPIEAYVGEIVPTLERVPPSVLIHESLDDPASTYHRIAMLHLRMRNDHLALAALETALQYAPDDMQLISEVEALRERVVRVAAEGAQ